MKSNRKILIGDNKYNNESSLDLYSSLHKCSEHPDAVTQCWSLVTG